jgi:hypothetical protein
MAFGLGILSVIGLVSAGTVAAGYEFHKKNKRRHPNEYPQRFYDSDKGFYRTNKLGGRGRGPGSGYHRRRHPYGGFYDNDPGFYPEDEAYEDEYFDPRPPPISRRNPNDVSLFDDYIKTVGNYAARSAMRHNARHRMTQRFGYRASVWDLEQFLT